MFKHNKSLSSKLISVLLVISMLVGMCPYSAIRANVDIENSMGTIDVLVDGGQLDGNTVTFSGAELEWAPADSAIGRWTDGWWVGIKVTAPESVNLEEATYQNKTSTGWGEVKNFKVYRDSDDNSEEQYITLWGIVNREYIINALFDGKEYLEYGYQFDWDGDGEYEQPVSMRVVPDEIVLNKDGEQIYPETSALAEVETITSGISVSNNGSSIVVVENATTIELDWVAKDDSAGRTSDGWWIGYNVIAPEGWNAENASYQHKSSTGWGEAYSFDEYRDTDNSIQVWRLVNEAYLESAISNNKDVNYVTRYDWDGDGVYEQIIHLKAIPSNIVLNNGSEQVYPYLGTVTPLTGGVVSGNTSNLELRIEETTLEWSPKDVEIGRNTDGWWVGMNLTAPKGATVEQLKKATYKRRVTSAGGTSWSAYDSELSFWSKKDSDDAAESHYIGLWMVINPALVAKYSDNGTEIKTEYVFDWDGDGVDDQTITLTVVPGDKIILKKVAQTGFAFAEPNPVDKWVGQTYRNLASGGNGNGKITYAVTAGADVAEINPTTGELKFKKVGTVTVTATKAGDDTYEDAVVSYTVKSIKSPQSDEFKFANSNISIGVEFKEGTYTNVASGGSGEGKITYSVSDSRIAEIDPETGTVTFKRAGQVTIYAVKEEDDLYYSNRIMYTLNIAKSEQDELYFKTPVPSQITFSPDAQTVLPEIGGGNVEGQTYSIVSGGEYVTIDSKSGSITTKKAGVSFIVKVTKAGDDGYYATSFETDAIYVEYAEQTGFAFADKTPASITFNENNNIYKNIAGGGESTGKITYAFADTESEGIANVDPLTGEVQIEAAGTIRVTATKAGDDCYKEATTTYSLTIEKDDPEFTVNDVSLIYGALEYQIEVKTELGGDGAYVYSIEGVNNIGASVDANGKITFSNSTSKVGSITVKVKKEADSQYNELEKTFTLMVSYHEPSAEPVVSGDKKNDSGWYTGIVTIAAPEGYLISYSNDLTGTVWSDVVTVDVDGDNSKSVYLKKGNEISGAITYESIKIDTTVPADVEIIYDTPFIEKMTFGIYKAKTVNVTLKAIDVSSGIDHFTYSIGNGDVVVNKEHLADKEDGTVEYSFAISAQYRDKVTMTATDVSGWTSELEESNHILVIDTASPVLDVKYDFTGRSNLGDTIYTNGDVTVRFEIKEDNFDLRMSDPLFKIGELKIVLEWTYDKSAGAWKAEQILSGDNTYNLAFTFSDASGNELEAYEKTVIIDSVKPVISSNYGFTAPVKENIFNQARTATFTVTESNFNANDVVLTVTAKDITGKDVDISSKGYAEYAKNPENWTKNGNIYTIELPAFDIDAIYTVDIAYTDLARNEADDYKVDEFIIDKADATNVKIEYSTSLIDKVLENITFGFYKADVVVTVTAEDITSGVDYFVVTYTQEDGENNSNKETYTTENLNAVQNSDEKNVFTATHTITAEARGKASVQIVDNATNDTEKADQYVIVADKIAPGLDYKWTFANDQVREYNNIYYTQGEVVVEFTIEEANFDLSFKTAEDEAEAPAPELTINGVREHLEWTQIEGTDNWTAATTIISNGDYVIELNYTDRSTNAMETYTKEVHIDDAEPVIEVTYDNNDAKNDNNYKANRTATVKVTEHNFNPEDVKLEVIAKDITGADVNISSKAYKAYAKNANNWKYKDAEGNYVDDAALAVNADEHYIVLPVFDIDAIYSVKLDYTDLAENEANPYSSIFVIDKTIAAVGDIAIEYSTPIAEKILETVTFGFYKGDVDVNVNVSVKDQTSGIEYFEIYYTAVDGQNNSNKDSYVTDRIVAVQDENDKSVFTAVHTISAEARGTVAVNLADKAGNTADRAEAYVVVADTIAPGLDVEYHFTNNQVREYDNIYYTQDEVTVEFTITEANFDLSLKTAEDETEAPAPVLTINGVPQSLTWTQIEGTDKWVTEITLTGNGDYVVELSYTDRSTNAMDIYTKEVHIDNIPPVIEVAYDNDDARNENNYKANRTATVKVTEHNFKGEEAVLTVTAHDITGAEVDISSKEYAAYVQNANNWKYKDVEGNYVDDATLAVNSDEHYIVLPAFDIDARYSVKLEYTDLAENEAEPYEDVFVIDKTITEAEDVVIEYSTPVAKKILNAVTFGFYQSEVEVTVTAKDQTAGIESFEICYNPVDEKNNSNTAGYCGGKLEALQDVENKNVFTAKDTIPAEARGYVSVIIIDKAGNSVDTDKLEENNRIVTDTIAPGLDCEWIFTDGQVREYNDIFYTKKEATVKFTITEANFDLSLIQATESDGEEETAAHAPVLTVNGIPENIIWTQIEGTDKWQAEFTLIEGDYVVELSYTDRSANAMDTYTKEVHIDDVAPVIEVTYDNNDARNENNYKANRTATVKVTEHNFKGDEAILTVTAKDICGNNVEGYTYFDGADGEKYVEEFYDYVKDANNWKYKDAKGNYVDDAALAENPDEHYIILPEFAIEAIYSVKLEYTDLAENAAEPYEAEFVIDKTKPDEIKIEYSEPINSIIDKVLDIITFGFYKSEAIVTVTAQDDIAGVECFKITYTKSEGTSNDNEASYTTEELIAIQDATNKNIFTATHTIPANARGTVSVELIDKAGNDNNADNPEVLVVDKINPTREVIYTPYKILDATTKLEVNDYHEGDDSILYYKNSAVVTFKITEANFDLSLMDESTKPVIKVNDLLVNVEWSNEGDVWSATHTINGDGDYVVTMTYTDLSTNEMVKYTSCKIAIDSTAPVVNVKYVDGVSHQIIDEHKYYKTTQTVEVTVTEHNFLADDVVLIITAEDIEGNYVDISSKKYTDYAKNGDNWTSNGDVHTLNIGDELEGMVFDIDAIYTFDIVYDDIIDNYAEDYLRDNFVIDHEAPTDLAIEYSNSIVDKIIEAVTFGYYKPAVTVTLTANDITSGVDYFDWTYTREDGASNTNTESLGGRISSNDGEFTATAEFTIPANARGYITADVTDRAGNSTGKSDKDNITVVVDEIEPKVSVEYKADNDDTKVQFIDKNNGTVDTFDKAVNAFYNGNVTAKIVIDEANFFEGVPAIDVATDTAEIIHNVGIKLTKTDDNGNETVYEYLPEGSVEKYPEVPQKKNINWTTSGDEHYFEINYEENADYVLEIEYMDLSENDAVISANDGNAVTKSYKSKVVTVDKTAPVVSVKYGNKDVVHTIDGRDYLDAKQTATITVEEHNFRANDFAATVIAKDVSGNDVSVENFKATLSSPSKWTKNGNVYTITINYDVDANYSFDYEFKDLAQNAAAEYSEDLFTVDTTAPENLAVEYSTSVLDKILESVTFGYYNAKMTVTISAEDDTAGVYYFVYSYIKSDGVSDVNAELINDKIEEASSRIIKEGNKFTTSFTIPKLLLENDNQFNGTVEFTAFDRSENNTEKVDNRRVVVDNIAPTATITYNNPVQNVNNISYYNGNINATIVVNEANFYSEDIVVTATKDGVNYPVTVKWTDNSVDVHTGTFTLVDNGDYIITVDYKDRSDNAMTKYTSNRLTLDTKTPVIDVTNIKNNSANKDELYGFVITANDINLDASTFTPVLTAVVRNDDGSYETKTMSIGEMKTVEVGKTYTYTVENLEEDAVYTLVCTLKDMSGNTYSKILLDDGAEYDEVRFSVNRNGSTFAVDKNTDELVNRYYVYSVNEDVIIEEINVDPVETYSVKLNGETLNEGSDYTSVLSDNEGEWSKRTYTISKELFETEGEYNIVVESIDKAETTAYSDVKNLNVSFVVDQTAPMLTISGLANGGRYQVEEQTVTVIPTDDGGRLYSIKVIVMDSDGEPLKDEAGNDISVRFEMSGEEFLTYLSENNGKITFTIPEVLEHQVQIICNDCAVNTDGKTNEYNETFTKVTVSQSGWIIFYANKPLFYGTIAGIVLLSGVVITLIALKKRKKEAKK